MTSKIKEEIRVVIVLVKYKYRSIDKRIIFILFNFISFPLSDIHMGVQLNLDLRWKVLYWEVNRSLTKTTLYS